MNLIIKLDAYDLFAICVRVYVVFLYYGLDVCVVFDQTLWVWLSNVWIFTFRPMEISI